MSTKAILTAVAILFSAVSVQAKITAFKCRFGTTEIYFTFYSDGTPTRVGTSTGIGNTAHHFIDSISGAVAVVETNIDGFPITFTTIMPDLTAIQSRHVIVLGEVSIPSQTKGKCQRVAL